MQKCPSCGYEAGLGAPLCGNCGHPFGDFATGLPLAAPRRRDLIIAVAVLLLFGGIGMAVWTRATEIISSIGEVVSSLPQLPQAPQDVVDSPYAGVRALAARLNKGGLRCKQIKVDAKNENVSTGSCQVKRSNGIQTHVQINIYFDEASLRSVEQHFRDRTFTYVHDANWFVITQPPVARRVHKILGGRLSLAR